MKKLILLVPTIMVTAFLALSFLLPGMAAGAVRSIAPAIQSLPSSFLAVASDGGATVAKPNKLVPAPVADLGGSGAESPKAPPVTSTSQQTIDHGGHAVATAGQTNCDRMGNGHHSGKHDFTCPNTPFPAPVISHS